MKRKALVIGVNQYKGSIFCPQYSLKDAEDIAQLLRTFGRFDEVQVLLNQFKEQDKDHKNPYEPDKLKILIEQLFNPQDGDTETALFYFSGNGAGIYGAEEKETQKGDLLLTDFPDPLTESQSEPTPTPKSRSISLKWLHDQLEKSPVKQQIVWLDSDFSDLFIDSFSQPTIDSKDDRDRCFIAAKPDSAGYAGETSTHGVLTDALLQGLNSVKQIKNSITNHDLVDDLLSAYFLERVLPQQKLALLQAPKLSTADSILWKNFLWEQYGQIQDIDQRQLANQKERRQAKETEKAEQQAELNTITNKIQKIQQDQQDRTKELQIAATSEVKQAVNSALGISKYILSQRLGKPVFDAIEKKVNSELSRQGINPEAIAEMRDSAIAIVTKILEEGKVQQLEHRFTNSLLGKNTY